MASESSEKTADLSLIYDRDRDFEQQSPTQACLEMAERAIRLCSTGYSDSGVPVNFQGFVKEGFTPEDASDFFCAFQKRALATVTVDSGMDLPPGGDIFVYVEYDSYGENLHIEVFKMKDLPESFVGRQGYVFASKDFPSANKHMGRTFEDIHSGLVFSDADEGILEDLSSIYDLVREEVVASLVHGVPLTVKTSQDSRRKGIQLKKLLLRTGQVGRAVMAAAFNYTEPDDMYPDEAE